MIDKYNFIINWRVDIKTVDDFILYYYKKIYLKI
jgi:hypothetical protein